MAALLLLLKTNWKPILIGLAVLMLLGYIQTLRLEVKHYKSSAIEAKQELKDAQITAKAEHDRQTAEADAITKAHLDTLRRKGDEIMKGYNDVVTKIKAHEASKHVIITPDVVSLFNESTGNKPTSAPEAKPANDGKTSTTETTLNQLLVVTAENNANHLKCIAQVEEWQAFWEAYAISVGRAN